MDEVAELACYYRLFKKLGFCLDSKFIGKFENRIKLQKMVYLAKSLASIPLLKEQELNYSWYLQGVYSQRLADKYYKIAEMSNILDNYISKHKPSVEAKVPEEEVSKIKKKILKLSSNTRDTNEKYILFSSLHYLFNSQPKEFDILWKRLVDKKPQFNTPAWESVGREFYKNVLHTSKL